MRKASDKNNIAPPPHTAICLLVNSFLYDCPSNFYKIALCLDKKMNYRNASQIPLM